MTPDLVPFAPILMQHDQEQERQQREQEARRRFEEERLAWERAVGNTNTIVRAEYYTPMGGRS